MLDLRRLDILQRFAALGSIAAAAAELGYSPSAVSQQLATLERETGVALIERTAQRASLTDAGRELVEHAAIVLGAAEAAESRMRARAGTIAGHVHISCIPGLAEGLAPHLAALQRRHPDLSVVAHQTDSTTAAMAVLDRATDLAVIDDWVEDDIVPPAGLVVHRVHREQVVLAVPSVHGGSRRTAPVSAAQLRETVEKATWLCAPRGQPSRMAGDERLDAVGARPVRRWEFEGLHVLARLVRSGAGIALLPASIADNEVGVLGLPLRPRMYRYVHVLTRSTTQHDPVIASCLTAVRQALDPSPSPHSGHSGSRAST